MAIGSETLSAENRSINSVFKAACGTQTIAMMFFAMNSKFLFWARGGSKLSGVSCRFFVERNSE
jgi:hypothetical protein